MGKTQSKQFHEGEKVLHAEKEREFAKEVAVEPPYRAIVLAAGRGKRLRPFTDHTPKPLLPVNGRPTLDYVLKALQNVGVTEVALVVNYLAEQIEAYVGSGAEWGMNATFFHQATMAGTGDAVQTAVSFIESSCYIVAADYILPPDYLRPLRHAYLQEQTALVTSLKALPPAELSQRSSVRFDASGQIVEIVEKPAPGQAPSSLGASLIYIVPPAIKPYLAQLTESVRQERELQQAINGMLRDGRSMHGVVQAAPVEWEAG